jgi:hypothetical protein
MYTDDAIFIVVGVDRTLRFLELWGTFVLRSRARNAIPEKRTLGGAGLLWCGVMSLPCLAMAYVTRSKVVRACSTLERVARCKPRQLARMGRLP